MFRLTQAILLDEHGVPCEEVEPRTTWDKRARIDRNERGQFIVRPLVSLTEAVIGALVTFVLGAVIGGSAWFGLDGSQLPVPAQVALIGVGLLFLVIFAAIVFVASTSGLDRSGKPYFTIDLERRRIEHRVGWSIGLDEIQEIKVNRGIVFWNRFAGVNRYTAYTQVVLRLREGSPRVLLTLSWPTRRVARFIAPISKVAGVPITNRLVQFVRNYA